MVALGDSYLMPPDSWCLHDAFLLESSDFSSGAKAPSAVTEGTFDCRQQTQTVWVHTALWTSLPSPAFVKPRKNLIQLCGTDRSGLFFRTMKLWFLSEKNLGCQMNTHSLC